MKTSFECQANKTKTENHVSYPGASTIFESHFFLHETLFKASKIVSEGNFTPQQLKDIPCNTRTVKRSPVMRLNDA